ncbi:hypothetical protein ACSBR2_025737 [Camellia fascicularis]
MLGGGDLYKRAIVRGSTVSVGGSVLLTGDLEEYPPIYFVEYMFEELDGRKVVHGRLLIRRSQTVLGNTANEREVFMTNDCLEFELLDIVQTMVVEPRLLPWGYQHCKSNTDKDKADRARTVNRKSKGLPMEYFCKSVYCPDRGGFFCLEIDCMGIGFGLCQSCKINEVQKKKEDFNINSSMTDFTYMGTDNSIHDFVYLGPRYFGEDGKTSENFKGGRNVSLKAYAVCHLLEIKGVKSRKQADPESMTVEVRRFFRPEDISSEKAYLSDMQEVYYSEQIVTVPLLAIEGKCELPAHIKLTPSKERVVGDATLRKKGKCKEGDTDFD